ncbi:MAG: Uma2 family endonuclease [Leptolyngbyaceae cyanobacterium]
MTVSLGRQIVYPDSDGQPMADNTKQFRWIVLLKENLDCLFAQDPQVFVAGDLLWYPVEGHPEIRMAPDVMVVFGPPKGDRGSYRQWQEGNIAPQVVFEVLSPGNTLKEMAKKQQFYARYGVEEYYLYDPDRNDLTGFHRVNGQLDVIEEMTGWASPRLGIVFTLTEADLEIYDPDGRRFLTTVELAQQAEQERQRAEQEKQRAEQEKQRADRLAAQLRALGVDPEGGGSGE